MRGIHKIWASYPETGEEIRYASNRCFNLGGRFAGMNAAIMAVAKAARHYGMSLIGIKRGYNGTLCKSNHIEDDMVELDLDTILDIADQPGTYLRTARCLEFLRPEMRAHAVSNIREMGIEGIVVIGGDGSYHGALELCQLGVPCVGIPGTIDNDLPYTEMTLGYDTALNSCVEDVRAIPRDKPFARPAGRGGSHGPSLRRHCAQGLRGNRRGNLPGAGGALVHSGSGQPALPPDRHGQPARDGRHRRRSVGFHAAL